jgi:hypothetical protein
MYFGWFIFAGIAVLCVIAGAIALKRRRDYEYGDELYPDEVNEPEE